MLTRAWLSGVVLLSFGASVHAFAGTIRSPVVVDGNTMGTGGGSVGHLIDQSGLSVPFISGVTDFETYVATNPTHAGLTGANGWASASHVTSGYLEFDLGSDYALSTFALWTQNNTSAIDSFSLSSALDAGFTIGVTNLGSFTAAKTLAMQTFTVSGTGEFIRLQVNTTFGATNVNIGEVAFDTELLPEPATVAILGVGLAGIGFTRRPRLSPKP
jgi:hypothetical protein